MTKLSQRIAPISNVLIPARHADGHALRRLYDSASHVFRCLYLR